MRFGRCAVAVLTMAAIVGVGAGTCGQSILSVCDYRPPESHLAALSLQGSFLWFDGPYFDDRTRSLTARAAGDYSLLVSADTSGHELAALAEVRVANGAWSYEFDGSGDVKTYIRGDVFAIGALEAAASDDGVEVDVTVGIGAGRFRDVTPLATAIRIQNALLDIGVLIAPLEANSLLAVAQIVGEIGLTEEQRILSLTDTLVGTGLVLGNEVGVLGLLEVEQALNQVEGGRVCGQDLQVRVGVSAALLPATSAGATGVTQYNFAIAPDPITQLTASVTGKLRLADLGRFAVDGSVAFTRRLPDGWAARASYRVAIDNGWVAADETGSEHVLSGSLTTQIIGSVALSVVGELRYESGDEEISSSLTVHLSYDLF